MTSFANALKNTMVPSTTFNGAATYASSNDNLVDLFFTIGSSRKKDITTLFNCAFAQDPLLALKMLFWARDVRGGAGERDTPRKLLQNLEKVNKDLLILNLPLIPEYGRFDDLLIFNDAEVKMHAYAIYTTALMTGNGLAGKWAPRKGPIANDLRKYMNLTPKSYRKMIVNLTKVVETHMCAKEWDKIVYDHVPSVAASRYQKAFNKHDPVRYAEWKKGLETGTSKVNASALFPYDVIRSVSKGDSKVALAQWEALPNYLTENAKILPMIDLSGSMTVAVPGMKNTSCMDIAISLGLYIADKQTGAFSNMWLTFSRDSHIEVLNGNLIDKLSQIRYSRVGYDTNIESAFNSILDVAVKNKVPAHEMPKYLLVISDMEFNPSYAGGVNTPIFEIARNMFAKAGYTCPVLVWWNVNARGGDIVGNAPVKFDQKDTALISGFSPSIMRSVLSATNVSPRDIMLETLNNPRYDLVKI